MLEKVGILSAEEQQAIETTLLEIKQDIEAGNFTTSISLEDIHMHIEKMLIDKLGDVGRKLHTGRSRNDQVSTDFRLMDSRCTRSRRSVAAAVTASVCRAV